MKPVILIPAYQPDHHLYDLISQLIQKDAEQNIIVVNDGSTLPESKAVFEKLSSIKNIDLLVHEVNKGKGEALKTGFRFYLKKYENKAPGIVTADADGQHLPVDICRVSEKLAGDSEKLWIGSRKFSEKVPFRSRLGNVLTKGIFNLFFKKRLQDTQTGLRGVPNLLIERMIYEPYSGYDFELDMLAYCSKVKIKIAEIPIEAVYIDYNKSSHFNPLWDSLKVYLVFIRFSAVSIMSAGIDYFLFVLLYFFSQKLFFSIVLARVFSAAFNFTAGRLVTFKSKKNITMELIRYAGLAIFLVLLSYLLVYIFANYIHINVYVAKIISETILFSTSFLVQRFFIF